jgi:hypothetical protein
MLIPLISTFLNPQNERKGRKQKKREKRKGKERLRALTPVELVSEVCRSRATCKEIIILML